MGRAGSTVGKRIPCPRCGRQVGVSWSLPDKALRYDRRRLRRRKAVVEHGVWYWPVRHRVEYRNGRLGEWCMP
jgi:hypothetical protein